MQEVVSNARISSWKKQIKEHGTDEEARQDDNKDP